MQQHSFLQRFIAKPEFGPLVLLVLELAVFWSLNPSFLSLQNIGNTLAFTVELGLIHPPVGMNIFVIKSVVEDVKISTIFYGVLPFIITDILRLIILIAFPIIALYLPSKM